MDKGKGKKRGVESMSGESHSSDCPRCLSRIGYEVSTDWKPFDNLSSICYECGFSTHTSLYVLCKAELLDERKNVDDIKYKPFSKKRLKAVKEFDKNYKEMWR